MRVSAVYILTGIIFLSFYACSRRSAASMGSYQQPVVAGVYYFDGWTGKTSHITSRMDSFPERKPVGGWVTSTPRGMEEQVNQAADAGIGFFNFCWYFLRSEQENRGEEPLNQALRLYRTTPSKKRIRFSIMAANHAGYLIGPDEWPLAMQSWIELFKDSQYLQIEGKPYLSFFSLQSLLDTFGSAAAVRSALDELRKKAQNAGLAGVTIGVAIGASESKKAKECGFDLVTSYNDHSIGFRKGVEENPISRLVKKNRKVWNRFRSSPLPLIPTATLGWDMRAWSSEPGPYYSGYSPSSVFASVHSLVTWVNKNEKRVTKERVVLLYAWNEYGEGGWLTPSRPLKDSLLQSVSSALKAE